MLRLAFMLLTLQASPPDDGPVATRPPTLTAPPMVVAPPPPGPCTPTEERFECVLRLEREGRSSALPDAPPAAQLGRFDWAAHSGACRTGETPDACASRKARQGAYAAQFEDAPGPPACREAESEEDCRRRLANEAAIARAESARAEADQPPAPPTPAPSRCRRVETGERGGPNYSSSLVCGDDDSALDALRRTMDDQARRTGQTP